MYSFIGCAMYQRHGGAALSQQDTFYHKGEEDEDGPPLKIYCIIQGSSDKLCTSMSFPTNNYFLSGWVSPHISCFFGSEGIFSYSNTIQRWNTGEGSGM